MRRLPLTLLVVAACSANDDVPSPAIANIVPDQAPPGQVVTIDGSYFCQRPEGVTDDPNCDVAGTVDFGTAPGTPTTWMDTAIMIEVPAGITGTLQVQVIAAGHTSNSVAFTVE